MSGEIEILLVEDNMSDVEMTMRALKKNGLGNRLVHLKDGAEAVDFLFARGEYADREIAYKPKVILLDLKMPRMSGIEVLRIIRADERTCKIPVVILTSSSEDPDIQACYDLGVNSYVVKPVEFNDFFSAISNLGLYWIIVNKSPH